MSLVRKNKRGRPSKKELEILLRIKEGLDDIHQTVCVIQDRKIPKKIRALVDTSTVRK